MISLTTVICKSFYECKTFSTNKCRSSSATLPVSVLSNKDTTLLSLISVSLRYNFVENWLLYPSRVTKLQKHEWIIEVIEVIMLWCKAQKSRLVSTSRQNNGYFWVNPKFLWRWRKHIFCSMWKLLSSSSYENLSRQPWLPELWKSHVFYIITKCIVWTVLDYWQQLIG